MCGSQANLFFGLTVRALDLVIAARHWPHRRVLLRALDSISTLRERGQLEVERSPDGRAARIAEVPSEVWALVKEFVVAELWAEAEHAFVSHVHDAGLDQCSCALCARAAGRTHVVPAGPLRTLSHLDECIDCNVGLLRLGGVEAILIRHEQVRAPLTPVQAVRGLLLTQRILWTQEIIALLASLDLSLVDPVPISHTPTGMPRFDTHASVAISLPNAARTDSDAPHGNYDFDHDVVEIDPRFFVVPRDAQDRFRRLLRRFPLVQSREQLNKVPSGHSLTKEVGVSDEAGGLAAATSRPAGSRAAGGPGKWLLWGCVCDCGL